MTFKRFFHISVSLTICISSIACKKESKTSSSTDLKLTNVGLYSIPIDDDTSPNTRFKLNTVNSNSYLSFYNANNSSIYIYDFNTKSLINKLFIAREGPNGINYGGSLAPQFFVHALDSIFIAGSVDYYIINNNSKILHRARLKDNDKTLFSSGDKTISFNAATYYKDLKLYTGITSYAISKKAPDLLAVLPFPFDSISDTYLKEDILVKNYEELFNLKNDFLKRGRAVAFGLSIKRDKDDVYATTPISDTVYRFKNNKLIDKFYTGNTSINMPDNAGYFDQFGDNYLKGLEYPFYKDLLTDRNYIYRILSKGEFAENSATGFNSISKGVLLTVTDIKTKITTYLELPEDKIDVYGGFVIDGKIYLKQKIQDKEDEITYMVFKME